MPVRQEPVATGLRRSLEIETAFARDYDAAHARLLPALGGSALLLLPLMFWLQAPRQPAGRRRPARRARRCRRWHGPGRPGCCWWRRSRCCTACRGRNLRQQLVMLLAWMPVLGLLQRRMLSVVGPWAYLSAVFYFLNVVVSLLIGNPLLYRAAAAGHQPADAADAGAGTCCARAAAATTATDRFQAGSWHLVAWLACAVLSWPRPSRTSWATSRCRRCWSRPRWTAAMRRWPCMPAARWCWRCSRCCWPGRPCRALAARYSASLVPAVLNLGRTLLVRGLADVHAAVLPHLPAGVVLR